MSWNKVVEDVTRRALERGSAKGGRGWAAARRGSKLTLYHYAFPIAQADLGTRTIQVTSREGHGPSASDVDGLRAFSEMLAIEVPLPKRNFKAYQMFGQDRPFERFPEMVTSVRAHPRRGTRGVRGHIRRITDITEAPGRNWAWVHGVSEDGTGFDTTGELDSTHMQALIARGKREGAYRAVEI